MADIDDLIGELYPADKKAAKDEQPAAGAGEPGHGFDDSGDDDEAPAATNNNNNRNNNNNNNNTAAANSASMKAAVPWPTLPPSLAPGPQCVPNTVTLTSYASPAAEKEQRRLLHLNATQLAHPKYCRPERPGQDDDGGRWCPYVRCRHCDHVVVRKQGVYWTRGAAAPSSAAAGPTVATASSSSANSVATKPKKDAGAHSFDDSSDDDTPPPQPSSAQQAATATSSSPPPPPAGRDDEAMYMLMRYHYPDFSAFPAGCLAPAPHGTASAAYCCQCTWVSVFEASLQVAAPPIAGSPPVPVPPQPTAHGLEPAPTSRPAGIQWACRGHTC